jgi:hypothetical protein
MKAGQTKMKEISKKNSKFLAWIILKKAKKILIRKKQTKNFRRRANAKRALKLDLGQSLGINPLRSAYASFKLTSLYLIQPLIGHEPLFRSDHPI